MTAGRYWIISVLFVAFIFTSAFVEEDGKDKFNCVRPQNHPFSVNQLRSGLVGGEWHYTFSYTTDSCMIIDDLIDAPPTMSFSVCDDETLIKDTSFRKARRTSNFRNIKAQIVEFTGMSHEVFPVNSSKLTGDSLLANFGVFLRRGNNPIGLKREYNFYIKGFSNDTMVVWTGRHYNIRSEKPWEVSHVFYRKK